MKKVKQNVYKRVTSSLGKKIQSDLEKQMEKFKDPLVLGELVYSLLEERENTNRILKTLLRRIEELQNRLMEEQEKTRITIVENNMEEKKNRKIKKDVVRMDERILPKIDESILNAVKKLKKATARDIQKQFKYKGRNAASARLNKLYSLGLLTKRQVGRTVYFLPK